MYIEKHGKMTGILDRDLVKTRHTDANGIFEKWSRMTSETGACVLKSGHTNLVTG